MLKIPQRFQRIAPILAIFVVCIVVLTATRFHNATFVESITHKIVGEGQEEEASGQGATPPPPITRPPLAPGQCIPEIEFLRRPELELTDNIVYSRRCIKPIFSDNVDREVITKLDRPLVTHKNTINLTSCSHVEFVPCDHLPIHVPNPYPQANFNHLVFGVATSYQRMNESLPAFETWLSGTEALLVAVIVDYEDKDLLAMEQLYAQHGMKIKTALGEPDLTIDQNHFTMLGPIVENINTDTKWIGILDDDTFFPSLYTLSETLGKHDHTKSMWLGALSEDFYSVRSWGFMAFGGAGVFLSVPLVRQLEPNIDNCLEDAALPSGDGILRDCVYYHSKTKLTLVPGLFQQDMRGDLSGFFEAGKNPVLSLHHWKSWYNEPVFKMAQINKLCGDCFLQRWRFGDDTLFTNGYSITMYRNGLDKLNLDWMEGTWNQHGPEFDFSVGPLRPKLGKTEKRSYRLEDVQWLDGGEGFRQIYVYKADMADGEDMDEVVELLWDPRETGDVEEGKP